MCSPWSDNSTETHIMFVKEMYKNVHASVHNESELETTFAHQE